MHLPVGCLQAFGIQVEGVRILHDELARPHDPEPRSDLVAEFGLNLIKVDGQLLVAADLPAGDIRDHFLMGGTETEIALVAVFEPQ